MKNSFKLNGNTIIAKDFDYNMVCEFEDMGIVIGKSNLSAVRGYIAACLGVSKEVAGAEIEQHVINGGNFDEINAVMNERIENSGFFQALNKTPAEEDTTAPAQAKAKAKATK